MWRIRWPDGALSDMGNITRVKDAAFVMVQKGPPARDGKLGSGILRYGRKI
jgi:hypothetical protein